MEQKRGSEEISPLSRQSTMRKYHEFLINENEGNMRNYRHKPNNIDTTKYSFFTFLPKALLFQFMRLANCYFLVIAIIQCIPIVSPLSPSTAIAPIAFVLGVSLLREAFEDYGRYKYDKFLNSETALVFRNGQWENGTSGNLRIGELVIVEENNPFPADLILLDSNMEEGMAYIETGTLDGEKTLKPKYSHKQTEGYFNNGGTWKNSFTIEGKCVCDPPNSDLYKIEGNLELTMNDNQTRDIRKLIIPLEPKQLLLKGAILKNTKWVLGFIVYTGHNTKLILNSKKPRMKFSRIETLMSRLLIAILWLQVLFCLICAIFNNVYYNSIVKYIPYLPQPEQNSTIDSVLSYFTYMLLLNTMIPISLIITLEIVKVIQGYFINFDVEMYSYIRKRYINDYIIILDLLKLALYLLMKN